MAVLCGPDRACVVITRVLLATFHLGAQHSPDMTLQAGFRTWQSRMHAATPPIQFHVVSRHRTRPLCA